MYTQKIFFVFILLIISIDADRDKKKICLHNLVINGENLITTHRKQLLVLAITNFNNQSSRIQANRFNDLNRELERNNIRDSVVRIVLLNEQNGIKYFPGNSYDKVQLLQDNSRDHLIKKLRNHGQNLNTFVFGRCGYLIFTQDQSHSDLEDTKNYQELLRVIITAVKNKRRCVGLCS